MNPSTRWILAANAMLLFGGLVAYATPLPWIVAVAVALAFAIPGLMALRPAFEGEDAVWLDRSISFAIGTWALLVMLTLLPFMVIEDGGALWSSRPYALLGFIVAALGFLCWNLVAYRAMRGENAIREARQYIAFHVLATLAGLYYAVNETATVELTVRGVTAPLFDWAMAPALAAIPGLVWALAFYRIPRDA